MVNLLANDHPGTMSIMTLNFGEASAGKGLRVQKVPVLRGGGLGGGGGARRGRGLSGPEARAPRLTPRSRNYSNSRRDLLYRYVYVALLRRHHTPESGFLVKEGARWRATKSLMTPAT